jgi:hypothetical protein
MKRLLVIVLVLLMASTSGCGFIQSTLGEPPTFTPSSANETTPTPFPDLIGPLPLSPPMGWATSLRPSFSWLSVPGATEYEFILATDAALTRTVASTPVKVTTTSYSLSADLHPNTEYFWSVQATKPVVGIQDIGIFSTTGVPPAPTPSLTPSSEITRDEAIAIASQYVPPDIVKNARVGAEIGAGSEFKTDTNHIYWGVFFIVDSDNSVTNDQLGWQSDNKTDIGLPWEGYNTIYVRIDAMTRELLYKTADASTRISW